MGIKTDVVADIRGHNICHYCRQSCSLKGNKPSRRTIEHIIPTAHGGDNYSGNLTIACARCNNDRGSRLVYHYCRSCMKRFIEAGLVADRDEYMARLAKARPKVEQVLALNKTHLLEWELSKMVKEDTEEDWQTVSDNPVPTWTPNKSAANAMKMMLRS